MLLHNCKIGLSHYSQSALFLLMQHNRLTHCPHANKLPKAGSFGRRFQLRDGSGLGVGNNFGFRFRYGSGLGIGTTCLSGLSWPGQRAAIWKWGPRTSLDLEKISIRNYSYFSLSSWRIVFSFLFPFSIFKILRQNFSFS